MKKLLTKSTERKAKSSKIKAKAGKAGKKAIATIAAAGVFAGSIFGLAGCKTRNDNFEANTNNQTQQQQLNDAQQKQIDELLKNYEDLEKRVADLETYDETLLGIINTSMETVQGSIDALSEQVSNKANSQDVTNKITTLQTTISTIQQNLATLQQSSTGLTIDQQSLQQIQDRLAKFESEANRLCVLQSLHATFDTRYNSVHTYGDFGTETVYDYTLTSPKGIEVGHSKNKNGPSYIVEDSVAFRKLNGEEYIEEANSRYSLFGMYYSAIAGWDEYEVTSVINPNGNGDNVYSISDNAYSNTVITINHGYVTSIANVSKDGKESAGWNIRETSKAEFDFNFESVKSSMQIYDNFNTLKTAIQDTFDEKFIQVDTEVDMKDKSALDYEYSSFVKNQTIISSKDKSAMSAEYYDDSDYYSVYENNQLTTVYEENGELIKNERETLNSNTPKNLGNDLIRTLYVEYKSTIDYNENENSYRVISKGATESWAEDIVYILDEQGKIIEMKEDFYEDGDKLTSTATFTIKKLTKKEFDAKFNEIDKNKEDFISAHEDEDKKGV